MSAENAATNKGCYLTTFDLHRLELACVPLWDLARSGGGGVYLVGSAGTRPDYRDVDVRMILTDEHFDALFGHSSALWESYCYAVSCWLRADTGLPVDFQVQRQTEANERFSGSRNPLGMGRRHFAGLGDATLFGVESAYHHEEAESA